PVEGASRSTPRAHVGPVLSGEKVLADGRTLAGLRTDWPRAIGVEMESLGVALAAYQNSPAFLTVKAVSDFADSHKGDTWRAYAAEAAARSAVAVLRRFDLRELPTGKPDLAGTQRAPLWRRPVWIGVAALAGVVLLASLYLMTWRATNDAPD